MIPFINKSYQKKNAQKKNLGVYTFPTGFMENKDRRFFQPGADNEEAEQNYQEYSKGEKMTKMTNCNSVSEWL